MKNYRVLVTSSDSPYKAQSIKLLKYLRCDKKELIVKVKQWFKPFVIGYSENFLPRCDYNAFIEEVVKTGQFTTCFTAFFYIEEFEFEKS